MLKEERLSSASQKLSVFIRQSQGWGKREFCWTRGLLYSL